MAKESGGGTFINVRLSMSSKCTQTPFQISRPVGTNVKKNPLYVRRNDDSKHSREREGIMGYNGEVEGDENHERGVDD